MVNWNWMTFIALVHVIIPAMFILWTKYFLLAIPLHQHHHFSLFLKWSSFRILYIQTNSKFEWHSFVSTKHPFIEKLVFNETNNKGKKNCCVNPTAAVEFFFVISPTTMSQNASCVIWWIKIQFFKHFICSLNLLVANVFILIAK